MTFKIIYLYLYLSDYTWTYLWNKCAKCNQKLLANVMIFARLCNGKARKRNEPFVQHRVYYSWKSSIINLMITIAKSSTNCQIKKKKNGKWKPYSFWNRVINSLEINQRSDLLWIFNWKKFCLLIYLTKLGLIYTHLLITDIPEDTLKKIPSVNVLHDLSNHIGNSIMQLAIELDLDIPTIQRIQQEHKNKLLEQTREIFWKWRQKKISKANSLRTT